MKSIEVITNYARSDRKFIGDYYSIDMVVRDNKSTESFHFGDDYHDKGAEKVEGAIDVLQRLYGPFEVLRSKKANDKI